MANVLQQRFPIIRDRQEVMEEIRSQKNLTEIFDGWQGRRQEEFLDYCTGVKGVKLLYDQFFKAVMNPEITPERLEELLSLIIGEKIKILNVLPADSTRIAAENTLLLLDIVVELENGSIANVEVQKIGYAFPGQRSACYSADLLLRQYKRIKGERGKAFSYKDIKKVYTIVLFEESTGEFHKFPEKYIHHMKQASDTGLQMDLLQEYTFIAIDIFKKILQNKGVRKCNKLDAWLAFLSVDEPERIVELIEVYPEFEPLYKEVYGMCRNMEDFMGIFSEELAILDKNTVDYMIDEMQDKIDEQKETINDLEDKLARQQSYQEHLERLNRKLVEEHRTDDLVRAACDREFQKKLLSEYGFL